MSRAERKQLVKEASEKLHNVETHSNSSDLDTKNITNINGSTTKVGQPTQSSTQARAEAQQVFAHSSGQARAEAQQDFAHLTVFISTEGRPYLVTHK